MSNTVSCNNCGDTEDLYKLPCNHIICKKCLVPHPGNKFACGYCRHRFAKTAITEYCEEDEEYSDCDDY